MNKEKEKHIIKIHFVKLEMLLIKIAKDFKPETIHQFRVTYKKLNAFLNLLAQDQQEKRKIKISKRIKKTYTFLGKLRNLHLQQKRVKKINTHLKQPAQYILQLKKEIKKLKNIFLKTHLQKSIAKCKKKTNLLLPNEFTISNFKSFVKSKWKAMHKIIAAQQFTDNGFHFIRKSLKDLLYSSKIYKYIKDGFRPLSIWRGNDEKYFYTLISQLGYLQDYTTAINLLNFYLLKNVLAAEEVLLKRIRLKWVKKKNNLQKKVVGCLVALKI